MVRKFNFGAGPATLPTSVLEEVRDELLDWKEKGFSVMEISHRSEEYGEIATQAEKDFRDLLNISDSYSVLFTHGGATIHNAMIPLNLSSRDGEASYIMSGYWANASIKEAKKFIKVNIAASSEDKNYSFFPPQSSWKVSRNSDYIHITPNETIGGISLREVRKEAVPIVADYSSSILSEPINVSSFGMLYGGAQKNIGPSGLSVVIVRKDLVGKARQETPSIFDYKLLAETDSMYNTPPTFSWYLAGLVFKWLKEKGGVTAIASHNHAKSALLYQAIDASDFYRNHVHPENRSIMNVPFQLADDALDSRFLELAEQRGLMALKGHRFVGGMRASIYNAMPMEGVEALVAFMHEFEKEHG